MITLANGPTVLELHEDMRWVDEAEWAPVEQSVDRTITGALIVQTAERTNSTGRPITLAPPDNEAGWNPRSTVDVLMGWAAVPGLQLALTLRGTTHNVIFRHHEPPAIQAEPVTYYADEEPTDPYLVTIRLMKV